MTTVTPHVPPADYPFDANSAASRRPRTPPHDYVKNVQYPFRSFGESRSTVEQQHRRRSDQMLGSDSPRMTGGGDWLSDSPLTSRARAAGNKAFLHHLKNLDRFSTIKGRTACCDNCPICKAMNAADKALAGVESPPVTPPVSRVRRGPATAVVSRAASSASGLASSAAVTHAGRFPASGLRLETFDEEDEEEELRRHQQRRFFDNLRKRRAKIGRVTVDRVSRRPRELTVTKHEYLEILDDKGQWWACGNVDGQLGYVPGALLQVLFPVVVDGISPQLGRRY